MTTLPPEQDTIPVETDNILKLREEINEIRRARKIPECDKNKQVADIIKLDFTAKGRFFYDDQTSYYLFDKSREFLEIKTDSPAGRTLLRKYGLIATEAVYRHVMEDLWGYARFVGIKTTIHRLSYYDAKKQALYLFDHRSRIFKITATEITTIDNGDEGVLFLPIPDAEPFKLLPKPAEDLDLLDKYLWGPCNFVEDELTADERRAVLGYWFFALFFSSIMPTKPIMAFVGEKGSGKSSTLRKIGKLLYGPQWDVMPVPSDEKDFDVAVSNAPFVALDNADRRCPYLEDRLALAATGGRRKTRVLYTTNEMADIPILAWVAITSRTPHFKRDDVTDRLLIMKVARFTKFKSDNEVVGEILANRDAIMSEVIYELQDIVAAQSANLNGDGSSQFRMADFANFCLRIVRHDDNGTEPVMLNIFTKLFREQSVMAIEEDYVVEVLLDWARENYGRQVSAKELFGYLKERAGQKNERAFWCKSSFQLSSKIRNIKVNLAHIVKIETYVGHARTMKFAFFEPNRTSPVGSEDFTKPQLEL